MADKNWSFYLFQSQLRQNRWAVDFINLAPELSITRLPEMNKFLANRQELYSKVRGERYPSPDVNMKAIRPHEDDKIKGAILASVLPASSVRGYRWIRHQSRQSPAKRAQDPSPRSM